MKRIPCHTLIPAADKYVMQYPPGTGFALALFREGFQVIPLYVLANLTILAFALLALFRARDPASLGAGCSVRACCALPDDQSEQGELLGAADHDGLRGRRLSHREVFRRTVSGIGC